MMNPKKEKFCQEYAKCGDALQSYRASGYKAKSDATARTMASRMLGDPEIKMRLKDLTDSIKDKNIAKAGEIQELLTRILRGEELDEKPGVNALGDPIVLRYRNQANQIKAAETLAKMQGAFDNRLNVSVNIPMFCGEDDLE